MPIKWYSPLNPGLLVLPEVVRGGAAAAEYIYSGAMYFCSVAPSALQPTLYLFTQETSVWYASVHFILAKIKQFSEGQAYLLETHSSSAGGETRRVCVLFVGWFTAYVGQ